MRTLVLALALLAAVAAHAHPGSAIAVAPDGRVYFVDTGAGLFSIGADGRMTRHPGPAFHWFAFDPNGRFQKTPWPSIPGSELRSAGAVVLSSDFAVTIGTDGRFYYPEASGKRVRIIAIAPSGARSVHATLPATRHAWVNGLAPGPDGSLYYTEDRAIRRIDKRGNVATVAENVTVPNCARVPGIEAAEDGPYLRGLAVAADGSVYVAASGCAAVLRVDAKGRVSVVLRLPPPWSPTAVAVSGRDVYVLEYLHTASDNRQEWLPRVRKLSPTGQMTMLGGSTR